jgi:hypothetical protein
MISELEKVDPGIIAGRKIRVVEYNIRNYRIHQVLEQIARMFLFILECDSNNTSSKAKPRDVRNLRSQWKIAKEELEFSMAHNDLPSPSHEYAFKLLLVDTIEIQKIRNIKMKRVASEIFNVVQVMLSLDSASTQGYIAAEDHADVQELFKVVEDCMARWIGSGSDVFDTGVVAPAYEILGEIYPDVDADYADTLEPSADMPKPKLPDVVDTLKK